jgi:hypothetical protein
MSPNADFHGPELPMSTSRFALPVAAILLGFAVTVAPATAETATIIDSFTDPFPPNPMLPATGAPVLFLGSLCDGAACPPATLVQNPNGYDCAEQLSTPGTLGGIRYLCIATSYAMEAGDFGQVTVDPGAGGRLVLGPRGKARLELDPSYGDNQHALNLVLGADGSDRIEIEILSAPVGPDAGSVAVEFGSFNGSGFIDDLAIQEVPISGPGVLSVPYSAVFGLGDFDDDVDYLQFRFIIGGDPATDFVVGEIRTAGTPTPAASATWGRIKSTYRR